jgi:Fur family iron response transcriptional regulator
VPDACPYRVIATLRAAKLRSTPQRIALCTILFADPNRHLTAETLHKEVAESNVLLSLATVYNTLHRLTEKGLLRRIAVDGLRSYFDTNLFDHHHFYIEEDRALIDIPASEINFGRLPAAPEGYEIGRSSVVIRLRRVIGAENRWSGHDGSFGSSE